MLDVADLFVLIIVFGLYLALSVVSFMLYLFAVCYCGFVCFNLVFVIGLVLHLWFCCELSVGCLFSGWFTCCVIVWRPYLLMFTLFVVITDWWVFMLFVFVI